jgi:hypothetical protein
MTNMLHDRLKKEFRSKIINIEKGPVSCAENNYYEAGINWPKKFPAKNICWY